MAVTIIFGQLFGRDYGLVNWVLGLFDLGKIDWQAGEASSQVAIATMIIWRWTGYNMVFYLAALQNLDYSTLEAARIDGAGPFKTFWYVTVPQLHGQYEGDRSRKETLIDHGFRLPSAADNRPLRFDEFYERVNQCVFLSATPSAYEIGQSSQVVEQIVRPTGLIDPEVVVKQLHDYRTGKRASPIMEAIGKALPDRAIADLAAYYADLQKARTAWEEQSEGLNGPRKNLAQADPALLGDAVQGAADAFLTTWEQRTLVLRDQASGHADALAETMYDFLVTDGESVEATQQLLLWEDRETLPVQAVGR